MTTITLQVNGQQAQQTLTDLKNTADELRRKMIQAAKDGDKEGFQNLKQSLKETEKEIRNMQSSTENVRRVLANLDSATPRELQAAIKATRREMADMPTGSAVWKSHNDNLMRMQAQLKGTGLAGNQLGGMISQLGSVTGINFKKMFDATGMVDKGLLKLAMNPFGAIIAAISLAVIALVKAFKSSEDRMNTLRQAFSALNPIIDTVRQAFDFVAKVIADTVLVAVDGLLKGIGWLLDKVDKLAAAFGKDLHLADQFRNAEEAARNLTLAEQEYIKRKRESTVTQAQLERDIAKLRDQSMQKDKYTAEQRIAFMEEALKKEQQIADEKKALAELNLKNLEAEAERSENDAAMNDKLAEARAAVFQAEKEQFEKQRSIHTQLTRFRKELYNTEKDTTDQLKQEYDRRNLLLQIAYAQGEIDNAEYQKRLHESNIAYYEEQLKDTTLQGNKRLEIEAALAQERQKMDKEANDAILKADKEAAQQAQQNEQDEYKDRLLLLKQQYTNGEINEAAYKRAQEETELEHLRRMTELYEEGTRERLEAERQYTDRSLDIQQERQKAAEDLQKQQEKKDAEELEKRKQARQKIIKNIADTADAIVSDDFPQVKKGMQSLFDSIAAAAEGDAKGIASGVVGMTDAIIGGLTEQVQAELSAQEAAINAHYDKQLAAADGNKAMEVAIEKKRQQELAAAKNAANKKMFTMQVIQAVAQTAQAAINAYSSAAAIPVVGFVMAPIAAAMAAAAGAIQIANLKKQQQQAAATGYAKGGYVRPRNAILSSHSLSSSAAGDSRGHSADWASGGYTPDGGVYEPAGIVHAGEWVASQRLLRNPVAAATIAQLDEAQRTNTIASLSPDLSSSSSDLSSSSSVLSSSSSVLSSPAAGDSRLSSRSASSSDLSSPADTLARLEKRLREPFVTVATIAGDQGIARAQRDYDHLIANKSRH